MGAGRTRPTVAAVAGVTVLVLAAVGAALAPKWHRPALPPDRGFDRLPEALAEPAEPADPGTPLVSGEVSVPVGDTTLHATVYSPGTPGRHPALVYVQGGGAGTRSGYVELAQRMARLGFVSLVYDKRTTGYTFLHRDYGQLADDALAMVRTLRTLPQVEPDRVGLWGISEGGWVVPIAAGRSDQVAFAILASAPTMSPGDQVSWAVDDGLQRHGAPGGARRMVSRALAIGDPDYVRHDAVAPLRRVRQPVLALYGTHDRAVPPAESARILADTLEKAGNRSYTIRFFAGADHALRVSGAFAPGYVATMAAWINRLPARGEPPVAGVRPAQQPVQKFAAVAQPPGLVTTPALVGLFALVAAGYLAGPIAALVLRRRRDNDPTWLRLRPRVRRMAGLGVGTAVGINVALGGLIAVGLAGGPAVLAPVIWAGLRLTAVGAVVATAASGVAVTDAIRSGWRPTGAARASLIGASGATGLVVLLAAYWELFAPRW